MKGFESKEHEIEFWNSLKRLSLPLKFAYTGDAAYTHNKLAHLDTYHQIAGMTKIEVEPLIQYYANNNPISQLCDVGSGNGIHSGAFLDALSDKGYPIVRYLAIDFSKTLLEIGLKYLKDKFPKLQIDSATWDFERGPTKTTSRWRKNGKVLITLTGQTLGNPEDPLQVLKNHFLSSLPGDIFLLGVALFYNAEPNHFLDDYRNDIFKAAALEPLRMAGVEVNCGEFKLSFSKKDKTIKGEFIFSEPITLQYNDEKVSFRKGDSVHCFTSRRFEVNVIESLLKKSGWKIVETVYDDEKTHVVYLSERGDKL